MTNPTFISKSAELAEAMEPSASMAAEWAVSYKRLQNPKSVVLDDGEQMTPKDVDAEKAALNTALKRYVEANGDLSVEGVGTLTLQHPTTQKVDVRSLWEHDRDTFMRLLESNGFEVNSDVLKGLEKAGLVAADVPRFPVGGSVRLVWRKDA